MTSSGHSVDTNGLAVSEAGKTNDFPVFGSHGICPSASRRSVGLTVDPATLSSFFEFSVFSF